MNLMGRQLFDDQRALHTFSLRDDLTCQPLRPVLTRLGFFELTKTGATTPALSRWRDFLVTGQSQDGDPTYICSAADIIRWVNLSQEERDMDKLLEKAIADQEDALDCAREEGARENQLANARVALKMGLSHADIAEITGLDPAAVDQLAQE